MSFTNNFHAPALGAAIFGEPEQDHVFQTSARPLRKQAWPNRSEPRKSHPSRGGPEGMPSAQAQAAWPCPEKPMQRRRRQGALAPNIGGGLHVAGRVFEPRVHLEAVLASFCILFYY